MATNSGVQIGERASHSQISARGRMALFDKLPRELRHALANSARDWSVEQVWIATHGGSKTRGIPARSVPQMVELIARNDARATKRA